MSFSLASDTRRRGPATRRLQVLKEKIRDQYRVRLILDNLPITTYDLELDPESGV